MVSPESSSQSSAQSRQTPCANSRERRIRTRHAMSLRLKINGEDRVSNSDPLSPLVDVLREEFFLTGAKPVCREGFCGACMVLLDGKPVASCLMPAGLGGGPRGAHGGGARAGRRSFAAAARVGKHDVVQCGMCFPGMVVALTSYFEQAENPNRDEMKAALVGNVCRCTGYERILDAALSLVGPRERGENDVRRSKCCDELPAARRARQVARPHALYGRSRPPRHAARDAGARPSSVGADCSHRHFGSATDAGRTRDRHRRGRTIPPRHRHCRPSAICHATASATTASRSRRSPRTRWRRRKRRRPQSRSSWSPCPRSYQWPTPWRRRRPGSPRVERLRGSVRGRRHAAATSPGRRPSCAAMSMPPSRATMLRSSKAAFASGGRTIFRSSHARSSLPMRTAVSISKRRRRSRGRSRTPPRAF